VRALAWNSAVPADRIEVTVSKGWVTLTGEVEWIEDALVRNAELDANNIRVEIQGSKAILTGTVRSWAESQEAQRVAWQAPGITDVDNRITVMV
jgi:osmotically-inducible protein OsmY